MIYSGHMVTVTNKQTRRKKTVLEKRREAAFVELGRWRKRNAKALKGWDVVATVRKMRDNRK